MRAYRITVYADKWPTEYTVEATNWATAIARGLRLWRQKQKGSRAMTIKVVATKSSELKNVLDLNMKSDD